MGRSFFWQDTTAPTATVYVPPTSGIGIPVSWNGSIDTESGIRSYEVEYKEAGGSWTEWLTETTTTQATFVGTIGMTYTFQVRATDNVDNVSGWVQSDEVKVEAVTKYYAFGGSKALRFWIYDLRRVSITRRADKVISVGRLCNFL